MNDTPTPRCDALEDQLRRDPEASRDFELVCFSDLARDLERQLAESKSEIDVLRRYGNKDCTAMADEELARLQREEQPNAPADGQCAGVLEMYYRQPLPNPPTEKP